MFCWNCPMNISEAMGRKDVALINSLTTMRVIQFDSQAYWLEIRVLHAINCTSFVLVEEETPAPGGTLISTSYSTSALTSVANNYSDDDLQMSDEQKSRVNEFLVLLATCNTVVVSSHSHTISMVCNLVSLSFPTPFLWYVKL